MSGDTFNITGPVQGSAIGGRGNTVVNHEIGLATDQRVSQLIGTVRAQAQTHPETSQVRAELLQELELLEAEIQPGKAEQTAIESRLKRLEVMGKSLGIVSTVVALGEAVRAWFS